MWKNYFKTAYRNLLRQKGYAFINIFGLAVGLTCCLLIVFFVLDELSYDRHHANADRIYRVAVDFRFNDAEMKLVQAGVPTAETMVRDFPEVLRAVRFNKRPITLVKYGDKVMRESNIAYADSSVFSIFTIPLLQGDPRTALKDKYTVVLSESTARKYFGDENPLGKILTLSNNRDFQVTGVYQDLPTNSHFHFSLMASFPSLDLQPGIDDAWMSMNHATYVLLREGTDVAALEAKFPAMVERYILPEMEQTMGVSPDEFSRSRNFIRYRLQPLTSIHLHSHRAGEFEPNSDIKYVVIFSAIALVILLIACINFMNLSTARSAQRAKEVGVRKVVGSGRRQLIGQFLAESVLLTVLAFAISLVLVELLLPYFNELAGKSLTIDYLQNWYLLPVLLGVVLGLLAGTYPAFYLSAFEPVAVLKGKLTAGAKGQWVRSSLVVFQFWISIVLLIGTWVITDQLQYLQNKHVGYNKEQVVVLQDTYPLGGQAEAFKEEMLNLPEVENATISGFLPAGPSSIVNTMFFPDRTFSQEEGRTMALYQVDADYLPTLGIEVVKGRNFSQDFKTDTAAMLLNESAARSLGWDDPIGKEVSTFGDSLNQLVSYKVVGVVRDFNFMPLRQKVSPLVMVMDANLGNISFKVHTSDMAGFLSTLEAKWHQFAPGQPFSYSFLDERFADTYQAERRIRTIFGIFSGLAIFIACLGLLGLATFVAEQRTKEIGIRKVLGASVMNLAGLLSKEFLVLVVIAFVAAVPVAWFAMRQWLQEFEYRVSISWYTFVLAGGLALLIGLLTVSYQAVKVALANPAKSLKTE